MTDEVIKAYIENQDHEQQDSDFRVEGEPRPEGPALRKSVWTGYTARALEANRLISVSPPGVERLLHRAGFRGRRAAEPIVVNGAHVLACWIEL